MSRTEQMISIQKKMEFKIKVSPSPLTCPHPSPAGLEHLALARLPVASHPWAQHSVPSTEAFPDPLAKGPHLPPWPGRHVSLDCLLQDGVGTWELPALDNCLWDLVQSALMKNVTWDVLKSGRLEHLMAVAPTLHKASGVSDPRGSTAWVSGDVDTRAHGAHRGALRSRWAWQLSPR